ncbi:MAG: PAS domain-containing hybrid sensor histidine kinase/response regulator [Dehalogenimonas sp.]
MAKIERNKKLHPYLTQEGSATQAADFHRLLETTTDGILLIDADTGQVIDVNSFFTSTLGLPRETLVNKPVWELEFLKQVFSDKAKLLDLEHKNYTFHHELPFKSPKKSEVLDIELIGSPYEIANQKLIRLNVRILKERSEAQAKLWESEIRFFQLMENVPIGIAASRQGITIFTNRAYLEMFGYEKGEDLYGSTFLDQIVPEFRDEVIQKAIAQEQGLPVDPLYEYHGLRKDGSSFPFQTQVAMVEFKDGPALLGFFTDKTKVKLAENETNLLRDKAEMNARLATVGEMAAGIAHEINNPLTGVIGFSELLQERKDLPPDVMENLQIINSGSVRVKEIVKRMLTFARQAKPTKSSVSVNELLDNTIEMRSYVLKTANIEVIKDYDSELPLIDADPGQLQQVFLNLIVNAEFAMKKAHDKGKLTITSRKFDDTHIAVTIADDGPGMTEAVQAKLFQPFFTTKDPGEGTGLGLSLSRSIVLEHNGTIEVDSKLGVGTTFTIKFPLIQSQDIEPKTTPEARRARRVVSSAHVLVVDDEPTIRALIKSILSMQGHLVEDTDNPQQALKMLGESHFDLIFLDIRMPSMSGMELHEIILTRWPKQAENIIFVTGDTSDLLIREYLATHQIPYISKPFDRATLEKVAGEMLAKPSR